jgi:alanyl-tRNA synthetase
MGDAYNELIVHKEHIENTILQEEVRFFQTIEKGMEILKTELTPSVKQLSGQVAFKLYDTYGFPLDLTADICREYNVIIDIAGFDAAMQKQQANSKQNNRFKATNVFELNETDAARAKAFDTDFVGYTEPSITAHIIAIYKNNETTSSATLKAGETGIIVLDQTVFYPEGGGQIGDSGVIQVDGGGSSLFNITDTQKIRPKTIGHIGKLAEGELNIGDVVTATYDLHKRVATARNHSVTHLLHRALHLVIGATATQKGSLVCSEYTRFDFAHNAPLTYEQILEIERIVNHVIMMNYAVSTANMSYDEAVTRGALALFGEKYTDSVRVIQMGDFSTELCGGTHVQRTGDIGFFKIMSETGVSNGVRRIEAITGEYGLNYVQRNAQILATLCATLKAQTNEIILGKVNNLLEEKHQLIKQVNELNAKVATYSAEKLLSKVVVIHDNIRLLALEQNNLDSESLLELVDKLKDKLGSGIIVIGNKKNSTADLIVAVTSDLTSKYQAPVILKHLTTQLGGRGGGRPDLARGACTDATQLTQALNSVQDFIRKIL